MHHESEIGKFKFCMHGDRDFTNHLAFTINKQVVWWAKRLRRGDRH